MCVDLNGEVVRRKGADLYDHQDISAMNNSDLLVLVEKYLAGQASEEERRLVDDWYDSFEKNPGLTDQMDKEGVELASKKSFLALCKKLNV